VAEALVQAFSEAAMQQIQFSVPEEETLAVERVRASVEARWNRIVGRSRG